MGKPLRVSDRVVRPHVNYSRWNAYDGAGIETLCTEPTVLWCKDYHAVVLVISGEPFAAMMTVETRCLPSRRRGVYAPP